MDALAVSEFLATFSAVCGAPQLNLAQLQQTVAWPLDGPELFEIYSVLIKYLLAQWVSVLGGATMSWVDLGRQRMMICCMLILCSWQMQYFTQNSNETQSVAGGMPCFNDELHLYL